MHAILDWLTKNNVSFETVFSPSFVVKLVSSVRTAGAPAGIVWR
jgi:hypothetical protein